MKPAKVREREIQEWLELAESGALALPSFQRSYVWKRPRLIADYLLAVFQNRPTGVFLLLKTDAEPQFESRTLKGIDADPQIVKELLLDGQQRLTSLWQAFTGNARMAYFVEFKSLWNRDLTMIDVVPESERSARGRALRDARRAYSENLVPLKILRDVPENPGDDLGPIWRWCREAVEDPDEAQRLAKSLTKQGLTLLKRDLHYFELEPETNRRLAIDIFVQSNQSSVKVNEFDIAVALALGEAETNLRDAIADFHRQSLVTHHYVSNAADDSEAAIGPLGEWLLFSACMSENGVAPKRQRFEEVIRKVFGGRGEASQESVDALLGDVESALSALAEHGARTWQTLPTLPALHVLSALQRDLSELTKASQRSLGTKLVSAYLWRSFFTNRYEAKANDRLFEDWENLRKCIRTIKNRGVIDKNQLPEIFDDDQCRLPRAKELGDLDEPAPWIRSSSRLGRALAALQLSEDPIDWVTNEKLDTSRIRDLEEAGRLDRHHVFPRKVLNGLFKGEQINHGLNGVLLGKPSNQSLSNKDPREYLQWILELPSTPSESELRRRVQSHLVPYEILIRDRPVKTRYQSFIKARARLVARRIETLCALP